MRGELRVIVSVVVLGLAGLGFFAGALSAGCTDGATPDCTGDAAGSCGVLPNEGGGDNDGGNTSEGGNTTDASDMDVDMGNDAFVDMDAQTDDSGDAGD